MLSIETEQLDFAHDVEARRSVVELIDQYMGMRGPRQERMLP